MLTKFRLRESKPRSGILKFFLVFLFRFSQTTFSAFITVPLLVHEAKGGERRC